jgi:hypothetical protein
MTEDNKKKYDEYKEKIRQLNQQLNECHCEMDRLIVESSDDFRGSHVAYFDGDEYVFMKVEMQNTRNNGQSISLRGPAIRLCDDPLTAPQDDDGIDVGSYDEHDEFSFGADVLEGEAYEHIRKISKKDMATVLDYYYRTMKENIL